MHNWSQHYQDLTNRNIGLLQPEQQETLRTTRVAICGLGGIGSPVAEMLCRLGVGSFHLLDHGTFEPTNLNRQIFCFSDTDGRYKTDVTAEFLKKINPEVTLELFREINEENAGSFLSQVDAVVLGIDTVIPCIIISRKARQLNIPLIEGWAVVTGNVRVFNQDTRSLEEVYKMPTQGREIADISEQEGRELLIHSLNMVQEQIPGLAELYPSSAMERMETRNEGTTLAPMVWLTCSMMAIETMKVLLKWGELALAPDFAIYNPLQHH